MAHSLYKWHSQVRDYELDSGNIVNHAIYIHYLEEGRNEYARSLGIDFAVFLKAGYGFVVASLDIVYRRPLLAQNKFYVTAKLINHNEKRMHFEQAIYLEDTDKPIATANIQVACVDIATGRACMPEMLNTVIANIIR